MDEEVRVMGLFGIDENTARTKHEEGKKAFKEFEKEYKNDPNYDDWTETIFNTAYEILSMGDPKEFAKSLKKNRVTPKVCALNIIQNTAMMYVEDGAGKSVFFQNMLFNSAYNLYNYINDYKLEKKYINSKTHQKSAELIEMIRCGRA